ncbi:MAG TPA: YihY/virulence factor BrkB family protein [Pseudonocardia sp.]|nr:YihY/virulence factor BrkB family protein [Pseudonocardia sp.]
MSRVGAADPPGRLRRAWTVVRAVIVESSEDRLLGLAAESAFFVVLGIFPALLIAASLLGLLDVVVGAEVAAGAQERVVNALDTVLTDQASDAVTSVAALFEESRGGLLTFATLGALVTLSGAFATVLGALNLAYGVAEQRSWLRQRLVGLLMGVVTLVVVVLALAVLVVGPLLGRGEDLADLVGLGAVFTFTWNVLRVPVFVAGLVLWTTALLRYAPSCHIAWRHALPGAVLTTVLWVVATAGFHAYLAVVAGANPVLGAFGGGIIVMTWVYLLSLALLLGGELNAVLEARRGEDLVARRAEE